VPHGLGQPREMVAHRQIPPAVRFDHVAARDHNAKRDRTTHGQKSVRVESMNAFISLKCSPARRPASLAPLQLP
jgi:hypothetical protein